jgi:hypothetical protein
MGGTEPGSDEWPCEVDHNEWEEAAAGEEKRLLAVVAAVWDLIPWASDVDV